MNANADTNALPRKPIPLGVSSWTKLVGQNKLIVDKTAKLGKLVTLFDFVFFSRPRRMGKTTLCSMLKELFAHGPQNFAGTAIFDLWPETKTYPVISLSFIGIASSDATTFEAELCKELVSAYKKAGFSSAINYKGIVSFNDLKRELDDLTANQTPVFLIDEWDYPLSLHLNDPQLFAALQSVLSDFYNWLRQQDNARFILVTGIMRYREVSLFTGQNIQDLSMSLGFADLLGYTKEEIEQSFAEYIPQAANNLGISIDELWQLLEHTYDGFCFDEDASVKVYSPYAINKFFAPLDDPDFIKQANAKLKLNPYWMESSNASAALHSFLHARKYDVTELVNKYSQPIVVDKGTLTSPVRANEVTLDQIMVQSGMLSIREIADTLAAQSTATISSSPTKYKCEITNAEVASELSAIFTAHMANKDETAIYPMLRDAQQALLSGDIELVCKSLNQLLNDSLYDVFDDKDVIQEKIYRTMFKMWLRSALVSTKDEVANSHGRCDLVAITKDTIYAFELKRVRYNTDLTKTKTLNAAERQMVKNDYCNNLLKLRKLVVWVVVVICDKYHQIVAWRTITKTKLSTGVHTERHEGMIEPIAVENQELPPPKSPKTSDQTARKTKTVRRKTADKTASNKGSNSAGGRKATTAKASRSKTSRKGSSKSDKASS